MPFKFIKTTTKPSNDVDFGIEPEGVDVDSFLAYYDVIDPGNREISNDGLTNTMTLEYGTLDEMLIAQSETSQRAAIWEAVRQKKISLGYIDSVRYLDADGNEINLSTIDARIAELRAEGKIPS